MLVQYEQRLYPLELAAVELREEGDGPRLIAWYPALFDSLSEDLGGFRERIGRRAFTATLQEREIRALINHNPDLILGRTSKGTLKVSVDQRGLHAETAIPDTSYARDLLVNIEAGNITGGSFMFQASKDAWELEDVEGVETLVRTVKEARLFDVSLVTFPAYPDTQADGLLALRGLAQEWRQKLAVPPTAGNREARAGLMRRRLELLKLHL